MAQTRTVQVTTVLNLTYFVPTAEFNSGGITESPDSVIGNYITGSRRPMLMVNTLADLSGSWYYLNPKHIVHMTVVYS
jgi:hypothetical protein